MSSNKIKNPLSSNNPKNFFKSSCLCSNSHLKFFESDGEDIINDVYYGDDTALEYMMYAGISCEEYFDNFEDYFDDENSDGEINYLDFYTYIFYRVYDNSGQKKWCKP